MCPSNDYSVGAFTNVDSALSDQLWAFLNKPAIVQSLVDTADTGKPPVGKIAQPLLDEFGAVIQEDRKKQFIGSLVRQVLERNGFRHRAYGRQPQPNPVFTKGSVYSRV